MHGVPLMLSEFEVKLSPSRKRSDIDILANILNEAHEGAKKTHIMYRCNLSHSQLQVYLELLLGMGFLVSRLGETSNKLGRFETTSKGFKFLDAYSTLKALMTL